MFSFRFHRTDACQHLPAVPTQERSWLKIQGEQKKELLEVAARTHPAADALPRFGKATLRPEDRIVEFGCLVPGSLLVRDCGVVFMKKHLRGIVAWSSRHNLVLAFLARLYAASRLRGLFLHGHGAAVAGAGWSRQRPLRRVNWATIGLASGQVTTCEVDAANAYIARRQLGSRAVRN